MTLSLCMLLIHSAVARRKATEAPPPQPISERVEFAVGVAVTVIIVFGMAVRWLRGLVPRKQQKVIFSQSRLTNAEGEKAALNATIADKEKEIDKLKKEIDKLHTAGFKPRRKAPGEVRGIDKMNKAVWRLGALKHEPPTFVYFDPQLEEQKMVNMKEVKLPRAAQTHELCYEPVTRCLFISQMSNSVMVRIPVDENDGMLCDDQDAWRVGPQSKAGEGLSGLHNLSLSYANPGCLWASLQFANTLLLLDASTMGIRQVIKCPTLLERADGTVARVGGPHCVRECGQTGYLWVALKGSVPCHPNAQGSSKASLAAAVERVCCNPEAIKRRMQEMEEHEHFGAKSSNGAPSLAGLAKGAKGGSNGAGLAAGLAKASAAAEAAPKPTPRPGPMDEAFAVWRIHPSKYDPKAKNYGGQLFECAPSPPMIAIDANCMCWVCQVRTWQSGALHAWR